MSISHFSRTFKEIVGEKYVEYITKYRLEVAKRLLLETDLKIDDIAEKVGYLGRNSFIRIFRKYEGITPGKYRAVHQEGTPFL
jgi:AraC-like DNA-binding protein